MSDELDQVLADLARDAKNAADLDRRAEEARQRVRANLPRAYRLGAGFTLLERTIGSLYVSRTIRKMVTGDATPAKSSRKRSGAAPGRS